MKPIVCIYYEGTDSKVAVLTKEKDKVKLLLAASFDIVHSTLDLEDGLSSLNIEDEDFALEKITKKENASVQASQTIMANALKGFNLNNAMFIPALTEPAVYYHIYEGSSEGKNSRIAQDIISDIQETKNVRVDKENLGYVELADRSLLSVFLSGEVHCIKMINSLARMNGRRFYKIPSIKSAEISLSYYVAKRKKFFPDDNSLIVYIGKEYSKLIFMHGRKLKHIGSTLDIGTINLHTYDVYFSKILLEMENGGISSLDNIVVCGEDDSENLILSFYGTFPEANVSRLEFEDIDFSSIDANAKELISSFSVPIAASIDYLDDLEKVHEGLSILPKYVREDQKVFQFAWHGYALLPLLFIAAFLFTMRVLNNERDLSKLDAQITEKTVLLEQNQKILSEINQIESKIAGFDQTQAILDSASLGTGVYSRVFSKISGFFQEKGGIWLTRAAKDEGDLVTLEGYALNKNVLTDFAYFLEKAQLKSIHYEAILEKNTYRFLIIFGASSYFKGEE